MSGNSGSLNTISYMQVLIESVETFEVLNRIITAQTEISGLLSIPMIPFLAFVVEGIIKTLPNHFDYSENNLGIDSDSFKKLVGKVRVGHKLLSDKSYSKKQNVISSKEKDNYENLTRDYNRMQNQIVKLFGQEDYGIFRYKQIDFATNIQGYLYFDAIRLKNTRQQSEKIFKLSSDFAGILSNFVRGSQQILKFEVNTDFGMNANTDDFETIDYFLFDIKRKNIFNDELNSSIQALLHSHLCQLNFIGEVYRNLFSDQRHTLLRFELLTFLEAIKVINNTVNNESSMEKYKNILLEIVNSDIYKLLSLNRVRNNIAHYQLKDYEKEVFTNENSLVSIIEYETKGEIGSFFKIFKKEFRQIQILLSHMLYN